MFRLKQLWLKISTMGVKDDLGIHLSRRVILTNEIGAVLSLLSMPFVFIFLKVGSPVLAKFVALIVLGYGLVPIVNYSGKYLFSRLYIILVGCVSITTYCIAVGPEAGIHLHYIVLFCLPMVLFGPGERRFMSLILLLPPALYLFLHYKGFSFGPWVKLSPEDLSLISMSITVATGLAIFAILAYLYAQYENAEVLLLKNIEELKNEIAIRKDIQSLSSRNQSQLKSIFDSATDAIFIVNREYRFINLNKATEKFSGPLENTLGKTVFELMGDEQGHYFAEKYEHVFKTQNSLILEGHTDLPNGQSLSISTILSPIFGPSGRVDQILGITRDISEHRRTEQLLREAKEQAESSNLAKSQFLATMSHEIRTPMGIILGLSEILSTSTNLNSSDKKNLEIIMRNGQYLIKLIDEILDLSKVEAGQLQVSLSPMNLQDEINKVVSLMMDFAQKKGICIRCTYKDGLPEQISTDSLRFRQILINIISNAIKYSDSGEVVITTSMQKINSGSVGEQLLISVKDQGLGISQADQKNLFRPFFQGQQTIQLGRGGTGLGLNLAQKLAQALGGKIELLNSVPGQGSEFGIFINPKLNASTQPADGFEQKRVGSNNNIAIARDHNLKILVVEDNMDNQLLIRLLLEGTGAQVEVAYDGQQGVEKALRLKPDLVLMDLQLPILSGHEAAVKLRAAGFQAPIVALTANAMAGEREKSLANGCTEYLTKPIDRQRLMGAISNLARKNWST